MSSTYDAVGNLLTVTDANNHTTTSTYDALNRQTSRELPLGMTETFTYDALGNQVAHTDFNGHTTSSTYDALDRLRTIVPDPVLGEPTIGYTYTLTGQRAAMSDGTGITTYAYDALDRLTTKATPFGTLSYTYDTAGNLLTLQSSNVNGTAVSYAYDDLNRLETVTDQRINPGATSYTYDAVGNLDTLTYPNGVTSAHTYDDRNHLTVLDISADTLLGRYTYTLDETGARTKLVDETGRTVDYGYDATYRLLNETITNDPQSTNGSIGYSYDDTGNRLSRTSTVSGISNQSASYDANDRPTSDTYDNNGNLLTAAGTTYSYNYANRLVSDGSITLTYDGDGNLVAQTVGGVTTTYLVDTQNPTSYAQIVEEQVSGQVQRTFSYGYDLISVNEVSGGSATPHFYGYDGLGTVRLLTNSSGAVSDRYQYEAFGDVLWQTGSTANPYRFTGERYDADLELYYLRARWYNSGTGRFLTRDTYPSDVQNPIELNRYVYTANNPVHAVDPSGLSSINTYGLRLQPFAVPASKAILPRIVDPLVKFLIIMSLGFFLASDSSSSEEINDNTKVKDILGHLKGSTQKAPFPKGFPGIQSEEIGEMTLRDVKKAAKQNRPGFKTLKKLLTDKRFRR